MPRTSENLKFMDDDNLLDNLKPIVVELYSRVEDLEDIAETADNKIKELGSELTNTVGKLQELKFSQLEKSTPKKKIWTISRTFAIPVGHRLMTHKGKCQNLHGHNLKVRVCLRAEQLNQNCMVVDFSDLKRIALESILDKLDHSLLLNREDPLLQEKNTLSEKFNIIKIEGEPTAETLAEFIYTLLSQKLPAGIQMDSVTVWENDESEATYKEVV